MALRSPLFRVARPVLAVALVALIAACTPSNNRAKVEIRGSDPQNPAARPGTSTSVPAPAGQPAPDASGIIDYGDYQSVLARRGETVATIAARIGMSASALGAYNGLPPSHVLNEGDELVLPERNERVAAATPQPTAPIALPPAQTTVESQPLDAPGAAQPVPPPTPQATRPVTPSTPAPVSPQSAEAPQTAGQPQPRPTDGTWDPSAIAAAIDRSGEKTDETLGAPPSSGDPVPPEPASRRPLESPDLGQYQTEASSEQPAPQPPRPQPEPAAEPQAAPDDTQVAAATPEPTPEPAGPIRMRKPVKGPVAVGFNKQSGSGQRNDGIDFAADAGAPVVAAADGEVALVSQSRGGLGTIVLVRHQDELLTVYGRIDGVSVKKGDVVRAGQKIGVVSNATAPAEPRMHFEVRRGAESLDPGPFLNQG